MSKLLSLDDVTAESTLLRRHDLTALHAKLEAAVRRRQIAMLIAAATAALAVTGGVAHLALRERPPPAPAAAPVVHFESKAPPPCSPVDVAMTPPPEPVKEPVKERVVVKEKTRVVVKEVPVAASAPPADREDPLVDVEGSRLRAQLRIFEEGRRALVGDPERALARARHLRERYPNGPLDIDAVILEVRALRALTREGEARAALDAAASHPVANEKRALLDELRAQLSEVAP